MQNYKLYHTQLADEIQNANFTNSKFILIFLQ